MSVPDVQLEMPSAPLNDMPSLFQPPRKSDDAQGTALRIKKADDVRTAAAKPQASAAPTSERAPPVRMRFASAAEESPASVAKDWSTAPREPVTIGAATERPRWSPYR
jgi:hypothetical protein